MSTETLKPTEFAAENNLEIVEPANNELQLDFDEECDLAYFKATQLPILKQFLSVKRVNYTTSKSGNTHAYIVLAQELTAYQRIALQACLGSDRTRELLSFRNVMANKTMPMFLFEVRYDD